MSEGCRSCWWREGEHCYAEPCERDESGYSQKLATRRCEKYWNKRKALETVIPGEMLVITSEAIASRREEG